jgi:hypothetical protein
VVARDSYPVNSRGIVWRVAELRMAAQASFVELVVEIGTPQKEEAETAGHIVSTTPRQLDWKHHKTDK